MAFVVVLDACVLVPHPLFDTLLRTADAGLYEPRWSAQILQEVERTLVNKLGLDREAAEGRIIAMRRAFPHAMVDGHEALVKDFPSAALEPYGVEALHPDDFLLDLLDLDEATVQAVLVEQAQAYTNPLTTVDELLSQLNRTVPRFAAQAAAPEME